VEFEIKTLRPALEVGFDLSKAQKHRMEHLNELDEICLIAIQNNDVIQQQQTK